MTRPGPPLLPEPEFTPAWSPPQGSAPSSDAQSPRKRSGTGLIISGSIVLGASVITVITAFVVITPRLELNPAAGFTRVGAPGPTSVTLEPGETDVWLEYFGASASTGAEASVEIVSRRTGEPVPVRPLAVSETVTVGGRVSERIGRITVDEAGVYRVSTDDPIADSIAFGQASTQRTIAAAFALLGTLALGAIAGITGATLLIIGLVLFAINRKRQRA